jgi:cell volume regulation protein A
MAEITDFATIVLVVAAGLAVAVVSTRLTDRVPVPAPALFLLAAAFVSDIWPSVYDSVPVETVERIAVVALVVILFNGGIDIGWRRFRVSLAPILSIGILGTFATAALIAVFSHFALGFDWTLAGILGAALAPTDPAVMFSVLGRREIGGRSGTVLEGEAGVNDPAGIALMIGMIELATHDDASILVVGREFAVEMAIGTALGVVGGLLLVPAIRRLRLASEGLYPVFALLGAGALYGGASLARGSGFLAVFIAGLVIGDARLPYKREIERFQSALASLAELVVFVALGLTIGLGTLGWRTWLDGALLVVALAFVARPIVVVLTLGPASLSWRERGFITWSGLKGAVPILLAAFAVLGGVQGAGQVYDVVFVVVLLSVVGQGTFVPLVARMLGIPIRDQPLTPWELSVGLTEPPGEVDEFRVRRGSRAAGKAIRDLPLGEHVWITLIVRNGSALEPRGSLELEADDRVLMLSEGADRTVLRELFSGDED